MARHKFQAFLKKRQWSDALARQFVDHALGDSKLPDAEAWGQLETYLKEAKADPEAVRSARYVWDRYEEERRQG
jgi:hypothetical protein